MPSCAILQCRNKSSNVNLKSGGISYHRFPKNPEIKEKWIDATGRRNWFPTKGSVICSKHFHPKDITLKKKGNNYLKKTAVPIYDVLVFQPQNARLHKSIAQVEVKLESDSITTSDDEELSELEENKVQAWPIQEDQTTAHLRRTFDSDSEDSDQENLNSRSLKKKRLEKELIGLKEELIEKRERILTKMKGNKARLERKIENMDDVFEALDKEMNISYEVIDYLRNTFVQVHDLVSQDSRTVKSGNNIDERYSPELKSFAHTLYYYSPEAYDFVRSTFKCCLPLPTTVKKWYLKTNGDPGFTKVSFKALKLKADASTSPIFAALVIDTMDLTQNVEFYNGKLYGYIDIGTGLDGDSFPEVKFAMVFMITAINKSFKVPVGYFLVDNMKGDQRAELVKQCIELAYEAGIKIVSLTMDGYLSSIVMAKALGCSFDTGEVRFQHPITKFPIVVVIDLCHIIKHIWMTFRASRMFVNKDGNKLQWQYLEDLGNMEDYEFHPFEEKHYLDFQNQRVKVKLATQPFSLTVAEALKFCRVNLNMLQFKESEATEKFLILINNISDIFNSRSINDSGFKKALIRQNSKMIIDYLNTACDYLMFLKLEDGTPLIRSPRKTGFLGLLGCVEALKSLSCFIQERVIFELPIYKLSQNHLKLLFENIQVLSGTKRDPTTRQFVTAYNKLLNKINLKSGSNNCAALEELSILYCSSAVDRINKTGGPDIKNNDQNKTNKEISIKIKEFNLQTVDFFACLIAQMLIKQINCNVCVSALVSKENHSLNNFIVAKDRKRVLYPSKDIILLCKLTETVIRSFDVDIPPDLIKTRTLQMLTMKKVFDGIKDHQVKEYPSSNHVIDLMKAVIECFIDIRIRNIMQSDYRFKVRKQFQNHLKRLSLS